jgi:NAD(P)-dependent dehydrogenase (short-subunit alcohol dehydrogenase family)
MNQMQEDAPACLVTGASSGIGAAMVAAFAVAGYRVLAAGRDASRLEAIIAKHDGVESWVGELDSSAACQQLADACQRHFGRLDVLVNNAGIYEPARAEDTSDDSWRRTLHINLDVAFFLSRASLPALRSSQGVIINIASDWGLFGGRQAVAYCASKGGLVLMTKAMALDHAAEGVRVNAICPGDVDTPMLHAEGASRGLDPAAALREAGESVPTGRVTRPDEVAALALFLASGAARQITGAAIPIDGGQTAI